MLDLFDYLRCTLVYALFPVVLGCFGVCGFGCCCVCVVVLCLVVLTAC